MIQWILSNSELISLFMSLLALALSLYSIIYTKRRNQTDIQLAYCDYEDFGHEFLMLEFAIINNSDKGVRITNIEIAGVEVVDFIPPERKPTETFPDYDHADPFTEPLYMQPQDKFNFSYYVHKPNAEITITVQADKNISFFSKTKIFIAQPEGIS